MENFFEWMVKPIPSEEVEVWFNIHNIHYEKIELFRDILITLHWFIIDTYFDEDSVETKITITDDQKIQHFEWCWNQMINSFQEEKIIIKSEGDHKEYIKSFFMDTFYFSKNEKVKKTLNSFLMETFRVEGVFTKSDLDMLTELYKIMDKSLM